MHGVLDHVAMKEKIRTLKHFSFRALFVCIEMPTLHDILT